MRGVIGGGLFLVVALACGGAPLSPSSGPSSEPVPAGTATVKSVCERAVACRCPGALSVSTCVAQHELGMRALDGVVDLQGQVLELGLQGDASPEAELMRDIVGLSDELVEAGTSAALEQMAVAECPDLCAALQGEEP